MSKCLALTTWPTVMLGVCHGDVQRDGLCKAHHDWVRHYYDPAREHQLELR